MGNQIASEDLFLAINAQEELKATTILSSGVSINSISNCGVSVLRASLRENSPNLFKICYRNKALMHPPLPSSQTPLHRAVFLGYSSFVLSLLRDPSSSFRAKNNDIDEEGRTALHLAVVIGNADLVALLIKYNATRNICDKLEKTPYQLACSSCCRDAYEIMEQLMIEDCLEAKPSAQRDDERTQQPNKFKKPERRVEESGENFLEVFQELLSKNKINVIPQRDLKILEVINRGSSCLVFKGIWKGCEVAVKQFTKEYAKNLKRVKKIIKEIIVLSQVDHPNILLMLGACINGDSLCIVTELLPNFTVFDAVHKNKNRVLTIRQRLYISIQIAEGLRYLHNKDPPITHRDLKPENCLIDSNLTVKICDFGLARNLVSTEEATTLCIGTTRFMAPELFDKKKAKELE